MKRKNFRLLNVLLLSGAIFLLAVPARAIDLYGFASYWDKKDTEGTWGGGLGLSLPLLTDRLRLDGRIYGFADSDLPGDDQLSLNALDLGLQLHLTPGSTLDPYLLGGGSWIMADGDRISVDSGFGGYLGAGIEWAPGLPLLRIFAEGLYRFSEIDRDHGEDIDVSGMTGNVGVKIHF